jgi:hypothetical protein
MPNPSHPTISRAALVAMVREECWVNRVEAEQALDQSDGTLAGAEKFIRIKRAKQTKEKL